MTWLNRRAAIWFASVANSPRFQFWMGLAIAGAGLAEVIEETEHFLELGEVGAMHGVFLVGFLNACKGVGELIEGGTLSTEAQIISDKMGPVAGSSEE